MLLRAVELRHPATHTKFLFVSRSVSIHLNLSSVWFSSKNANLKNPGKRKMHNVSHFFAGSMDPVHKHNDYPSGCWYITHLAPAGHLVPYTTAIFFGNEAATGQATKIAQYLHTDGPASSFLLSQDACMILILKYVLRTPGSAWAVNCVPTASCHIIVRLADNIVCHLILSTDGFSL